jgi:thioredoxin reductase (NADPH)
MIHLPKFEKSNRATMNTRLCFVKLRHWVTVRSLPVSEHYDVAVVGAGGAGTMAYLRAVLNGDRAVLFLGDSETKRKGRATWVAEVDNMPGMHDLKRPITATTKTTLKWIEEQKELGAWHHKIKAVVSSVKRVSGEGDGESPKFELTYESKKERSQTITASFVINATGVMDIQPVIDGTIKPILPFANRYDVLYCIRCDGHKTIGKTLSIIGNTDSAIYIGAMMMERYEHETISILNNALERKFTEKGLELAKAYGMSIHDSSITAVKGEANGAGLEGYDLGGGAVVESNCTIVTLGIIAYNQFIKEVGAEIDGPGRAVVSAKYESSVPGFFVVGDLVSGHKMQIYTAWDEAVDAADEINSRLRMAKREARLASYRASQNS